LERREIGNPPQVLVLVVAAIKTMVEKYVSVVTNAGLRVVGVETELLSLARSLGGIGKTVMLLDFGALSTDIAITKEGQLFFSRSIPTAGEAFTRAVAQGLGITPQQAEEYKKTYGFTPNQLEDKVSMSLRPILKGVVDEMKKSVHFYQMDMHGESPNVIVVSGGSAGLPGVSGELAKLLGLEVIVANPFQNVIIDPQAAATLSNYAPLYSVAVGLAMR
jgi:type IV pilus assembly protein PilM